MRGQRAWQLLEACAGDLKSSGEKFLRECMLNVVREDSEDSALPIGFSLGV